MTTSHELTDPVVSARLVKKESDRRALAREYSKARVAMCALQGLLSHGRPVDRQLVLDAYEAADQLVAERERRWAELIAAQKTEQIDGAPDAKSP